MIFLPFILVLKEGVQQNDVGKVDQVLQCDPVGCRNFNVNGSPYDSLLHIAARSNSFEICKMLVKFGADVNMMNIDGQSPLHIAEANLDFPIGQLLVRTRKEKKVIYNRALHITVKANDLTMCKRHINNVDINETDEKKRTPLHVAMIFASNSICHLLLKYGADVHARDSYNDTPIQLAFYYGRHALREKLLPQLPYFG